MASKQHWANWRSEESIREVGNDDATRFSIIWIRLKPVGSHPASSRASTHSETFNVNMSAVISRRGAWLSLTEIRSAVSRGQIKLVPELAVRYIRRHTCGETTAHAVASLGWVTPGAATEGVTPIFFSWKTWRPFLLVAVTTITTAFYCFHLGVTPSRVSHPTPFYLSDLVSPLFFVNLPTKCFFLRVSPPGGCHPGRSAPPPAPLSDATGRTHCLRNEKHERYHTNDTTPLIPHHWWAAALRPNVRCKRCSRMHWSKCRRPLTGPKGRVHSGRHDQQFQSNDSVWAATTTHRW